MQRSNIRDISFALDICATTAATIIRSNKLVDKGPAKA
jgi:hypothetical protein